MTASPSQSPPSSRQRTWRLVPAMAAALAGMLLIGGVFYIRAKAVLAQILLSRAFTGELASGKVVKPWPGADTWPEARIEVPRLGASAIVPAGGSGQLPLGPAHLRRTPEAGEAGIAVYAAHRDTHFAFLGQVVPGDAIVVTRRDGTVKRFRATHTQVVRWNASGIDPDAPGRQLALVTCWPLDSILPGPLRYVVFAGVEGP
jgi:sortase A